MKCDWLRDHLHSLFDERGGERDDPPSHLVECESCRTEFRLLKAALLAMRAPRSAYQRAYEEEAQRRVAEALRTESARSRLPSRFIRSFDRFLSPISSGFSRWATVAMVTTAALAGGLSGYVYTRRQPNPVAPFKAAQANRDPKSHLDRITILMSDRALPAQATEEGFRDISWAIVREAMIGSTDAPRCYLDLIVKYQSDPLLSPQNGPTGIVLTDGEIELTDPGRSAPLTIRSGDAGREASLEEIRKNGVANLRFRFMLPDSLALFQVTDRQKITRSILGVPLTPEETAALPSLARVRVTIQVSPPAMRNPVTLHLDLSNLQNEDAQKVVFHNI